MPRGKYNRRPIIMKRKVKNSRKVRTQLYRGLTSKMLQNVHTFKEVVTAGYIQGASSGSDNDRYISGALQFKLGDCQNVANLSAVFDQIRLNKVVVKFIPVVNVMSGTDARTDGNTGLGSGLNYGPYATQSQSLGQLYTVLDYDDNNALTAKVAAQQYSNVKMCPVYKGQTRSLIPACAQEVKSASGSVGMPKKLQWLDIADVTVPHYGVKYFLDTINTTGSSNSKYYEIQVTYYYSCKGQR